MAEIQSTSTWRSLAATGQLGSFVLLCLGVWLHAADSLLAATIMPAAVAEIGGVAFINWTLALYQLGSIVAAAVAGSIAARVGLRAALTLSASLYAGGCAASALAPSIGLMLIGRMLQGWGGGGMMALAYIAVCSLFPERFWQRLMVVISTIWGSSALCGPLIGGVFAEAGLWRWAFWAFALQAAIVILAAAAQPGRAPPASRGWALQPVLLLILGTIAIAAAGALVGTVWPVPLALCGLALLYGFARCDARHAHRLLPRETLDVTHPVGLGLLMIFTLSAATMPFGAYGPLVLGLIFGTGPLAAGYLVASEAIAWTLAALAASGLSMRAERGVIRTGALLIAAGTAGLVPAVPTGSIPAILACLVAQGAGFGMAKAYMVKQIVAVMPPAEREATAGAVTSVQMIGNAVGAAASGIAANAAGLAAGTGAAAAEQAAPWLFAAFVPLAVIGAVSARALTRPVR